MARGVIMGAVPDAGPRVDSLRLIFSILQPCASIAVRYPILHAYSCKATQSSADCIAELIAAIISVDFANISSGAVVWLRRNKIIANSRRGLG
jgi:hypothetical protein